MVNPGTVEIVLAAGLLAFGLGAFFFFLAGARALRLAASLRRALRDKGGDVALLLEELLAENRVLKEHLEQLQGVQRQQAKLLEGAIQKVGLVRFDAFPETGSKLSFALALLNKRNDGVVLCCLVGRDDCRLYAKPVTAGTSAFPLAPEERQAIQEALAAEKG